MHRRFTAALAAATAALAIFASGLPVEAKYPEKPINLIVPFPPGGAADVLARFISAELEPRLGQPVVVVNRAGAGTAIGAQAAATAAPDGYTLFLGGNSTFTMLPAVREKLGFDAAKDFEPIARVVTFLLALITYADNPIKDVPALIAEAKAAPDKLTLASFGTATSSHFGTEMFKSAAGIKMVHLPYKGSAPAMNDLVGKHIAYLVDTVVATQPQVEAGKVRPLAVLSAKRSTHLPNVPTAEELGLKGVDLTIWLSVTAPKGIPAEARQRLTAALDEMMKTEKARARATQLGFEPAFKTYTDWAGEITKEIEQMRTVAKAAGIKEE